MCLSCSVFGSGCSFYANHLYTIALQLSRNDFRVIFTIVIVCLVAMSVNVNTHTIISLFIHLFSFISLLSKCAIFGVVSTSFCCVLASSIRLLRTSHIFKHRLSITMFFFCLSVSFGVQCLCVCECRSECNMS